ncbi:MAG: hypothetical protein WCL32_07800 [Planctomycetota bacterium]
MKKFDIEVGFHESYWVTVEAENEEAAQEIADDLPYYVTEVETHLELPEGSANKYRCEQSCEVSEHEGTFKELTARKRASGTSVTAADLAEIEGGE